jgi:hypothetical protein
MWMQVQEDPTLGSAGLPGAFPPHNTAEYQQLISLYSDMQVQEDPTPGSAGLPGGTPTPLHCRVSTVTQHLF